MHIISGLLWRRYLLRFRLWLLQLSIWRWRSNRWRVWIFRNKKLGIVYNIFSNRGSHSSAYAGLSHSSAYAGLSHSSAYAGPSSDKRPDSFTKSKTLELYGGLAKTLRRLRRLRRYSNSKKRFAWWRLDMFELGKRRTRSSSSVTVLVYVKLTLLWLGMKCVVVADVLIQGTLDWLVHSSV